MMAAKLAVFLAANLLFLAGVHGTCLYCPGPPVIPTPPGFPTPPGTPTPPGFPTPPGTPAPPTGGGNCPINALTLGVCANVLNLLRLNIGVPPTEQCCPLLQGLVDLEAAVCLCIAIRANILGINLNLPIDLTLLLNYCGNGVPPGFTCPA